MLTLFGITFVLQPYCLLNIDSEQGSRNNRQMRRAMVTGDELCVLLPKTAKILLLLETSGTILSDIRAWSTLTCDISLMICWSTKCAMYCDYPQKGSVHHSYLGHTLKQWSQSYTPRILLMETFFTAA